MNSDKGFFDTPEFRELIQKYEQMKAENICSYFDISELADITSYYISNDRMSDAQEAYETALRLHRSSPEISKIKARIEFASGQPANALQTIENSASSEDIDMQLLKAEIFLSLKEYKAARWTARNILKKCEITDETAYDALEMLLDCGFAQEVLELVSDGLQSNPGNKNLLEVLAEALIEMQRTEKAIEIYNRLLDENPYSTFYWEQLGHIYYMIERYGKALECFDYELTIESNIEYARMMQGYCYYRLGNYSQSLEIFKGLSSAYPDSIMPLFYTALSHSHMGNTDRAIEDYTRILGIGKKKAHHGIESAMALINTAIIYGEKGEHSASAECMEYAMRYCIDTGESKQLILKGKGPYYELRDKENMTFRDMNTTEIKEWNIHEILYIFGNSLIEADKPALALHPLYEARATSPDTSDIDASIAYILHIHNGDAIEKESMIKSAIEGRSNKLFELFGIEYDSNADVSHFLRLIDNR